MWRLELLPFKGEYLTLQTNNTTDSKPLDIYEIVALAKRLNITFDDMKEMSFVSLINILLSTVSEKEKEATQSDIDKFLG